MGSYVNVATEEQGSPTRRADRTPERTCVVTRETLEPADGIRFVVDPTGQVVPDVLRKLPGRGVWVRCARDLVDKAIATKAFARAFKRQVAVPHDLGETVDTLLEKQALQALSLANKAGVVVCGFAKVDARAGSGDLAVLVQARDASDDGRARLFGKYRAVRGAAGLPAVLVDDMTIEQLSLALGRANVVHAGLGEGSATTFFVQASERLARFRGRSSFAIGASSSPEPARERDET